MMSGTGDGSGLLELNGCEIIYQGCQDEEHLHWMLEMNDDMERDWWALLTNDGGC